ncbi:MAG: phosphoglucosamine mutase [Natronospirillum sp.]|uniref:phosphoglucosamine mutase n=1 Tax=Natronospirillum sp. TaxID=2812955 RepID=UPI0025D37728|nr:phosphoglucosamine mutase [Natronospirillum sp.]MCH8553415.1 phosphoglucosamine mutase [Natronospirillum sp.]
MKKRQYFGTDGIRGTVGDGPINAEFMLKLGWAAGRVFARQGKSRIIIGKDTRISGYMFESALEAGLSAAGVDILLLGPMPTPAIAYLTQTFNCDAGIVISASHNPHQDNGIKFFGPEGTKLSDAVENAIEAEMARDFQTVPSDQLGKAHRIHDAVGRYVEFCKSTAHGLSLRGRSLVLDCAHGATYDVAPKVFRELGATVHCIGCAPDGLNINHEVGSTSPKALQSEVLARHADLGIAFDGDGDRVMMVDHEGRLLDGDELLYIMARHLKRRGKLSGGVVSTLMANLGLEVALARDDIELIRTQVGDRYVMEEMKQRDWCLGGEASGHLICAHHTSTGDGIIAALQVLVALEYSDTSLAEAASGLRKFPQKMINVRVRDRSAIGHHEGVKAAVTRIEQELGERGRVLLRPSGTEPVVRVMIEGEDGDQVARLCQQLAEEVQVALGIGQ